MEEKEKAPEERQLVKIEETSLEETQLAEQLYNNAGLDSVVDAGLKDYDKRIQQENKLISKVLGPRGSDIKGYGEAVAKRVAYAVYALLNRQYGGKVGDLRSYIMSLEDECNRANVRYDELMGRVVGILGDEYKQSRTDSKEFIEKLTTTLGEDLKESKIDYEALAERLVDIDGLRSQIKTLAKEKEQLNEKYESQITALKNEHNEAVEKLSSQIAERDSTIQRLGSEKEVLSGELTELKGEYTHLRTTHETLEREYSKQREDFRTQIADRDSKIEGLESEKAALTQELKHVRADYEKLQKLHEKLTAASITISKAIPYEEIRDQLGEELHSYVVKDSKVPGMVLDGVERFINFKKYLGMAAERGAREAAKRTEQTLSDILSD